MVKISHSNTECFKSIVSNSQIFVSLHACNIFRQVTFVIPFVTWLPVIVQHEHYLCIRSSEFIDFIDCFLNKFVYLSPVNGLNLNHEKITNNTPFQHYLQCFAG
jgi:hypothetical protein